MEQKCFCSNQNLIKQTDPSKQEDANVAAKHSRKEVGPKFIIAFYHLGGTDQRFSFAPSDARPKVCCTKTKLYALFPMVNETL